MIYVIWLYLFILLQQIPAIEVSLYVLHFLKLRKGRKLLARSAFGTEFVIIHEHFCDAVT